MGNYDDDTDFGFLHVGLKRRFANLSIWRTAEWAECTLKSLLKLV